MVFLLYCGSGRVTVVSVVLCTFGFLFDASCIMDMWNVIVRVSGVPIGLLGGEEGRREGDEKRVQERVFEFLCSMP